MKILYVLSSSGILDGATKSFLNILSYVERHGHESVVIVPDNKGIYKELKNEGFEVYDLPYYFDCVPKIGVKNYFNNIAKRILNIYSAIKLYQLCKKITPDIIHSNTSVNNIGFLAAKWMQIPHFWHIREYGERDFGFTVRNLTHKLCYPKNYVITITKDIAKDKKLDGLKTVRTIYNGIIDKEACGNIVPKKNYFLYAGRIEKAKGVDTLIDAFIKFKNTTNSNFKLKIAGRENGESGFKVKLQNRLKENKLNDEVEWLGEVNPVSSLMREAYATIVPSVSEAFGRVTAEAMAMGSLVIGRDTGGTKEQFDNGKLLTGTEIGLRFTTANELVQKLEESIRLSEKEYSSVINFARQTVFELYDVNGYGEKILNFYIDILSNEKNIVYSW